MIKAAKCKKMRGLDTKAIPNRNRGKSCFPPKCSIKLLILQTDRESTPQRFIRTKYVLPLAFWSIVGTHSKASKNLLIQRQPPNNLRQYGRCVIEVPENESVDVPTSILQK